jgi:hypothetical protein
MNRDSKKEFYLDAINKSEKHPKSMWNTINGQFFEEKVLKFRSEMTDAIDREYVSDSISKVMAGKYCHPAFEFTPLSLSIVKGHLSNLPNCKTSGVDNIDNYLLNIASEVIALSGIF